jgi:hypothetical protein
MTGQTALSATPYTDFPVLHLIGSRTGWASRGTHSYCEAPLGALYGHCRDESVDPAGNKFCAIRPCKLLGSHARVARCRPGSRIGGGYCCSVGRRSHLCSYDRYADERYRRRSEARDTCHNGDGKY